MQVRQRNTTAGSHPPFLALRATTVSECVRNRAGHAIPNRTAGSHPPLLVRGMSVCERMRSALANALRDTTVG